MLSCSEVKISFSNWLTRRSGMTGLEWGTKRHTNLSQHKELLLHRSTIGFGNWVQDMAILEEWLHWLQGRSAPCSALKNEATRPRAVDDNSEHFLNTTPFYVKKYFALLETANTRCNFCCFCHQLQLEPLFDATCMLDRCI